MDTETLTLAEFLLARIGEDEADPWRGAELMGADRAVGRVEHEALWAEAEAWEARVLAECEAKRRIVELHGGAHICWTTDYEWDDPDEHAAGGTHGACLTLRLLAPPYANHPDYRQEWRP